MVSIVIAVAKAQFPLGEIVITANAHARLDPAAVRAGLIRHTRGDWGEICPEDQQENERSLKQGGRLMSVYVSGGKRFWIITECDRSVTTILMPEDY